MAGKWDAVRQDLTNRLREAATRRIERHGLSGLRARDVTADAGCGLGTIYKCYADLDDLIVHVNSGTITRLGLTLTQARAKARKPERQLVELSLAYLDFATANPNLWLALFQHTLPEMQRPPEWHLAEHQALIDLIVTPLVKLDPERSEADHKRRARTMFAAVHGIVYINLNDWFVAIDKKELRSELETLVLAMASGLQKHAKET